MAGLSTKAIKTRIKSMQSTRQITKAMELVAASKLRCCASQGNLQPSVFLRRSTRRWTKLPTPNNDCSFAVSARQTPDGKPVYVVIAGDRGLSGRL